MWLLTACLLIGVRLPARLPVPAGSPVRAATLASSRGQSASRKLVMLAKKRKGKANPAAAKALEALEQWEANLEQMEGAVDDGLAPVSGKKPKKAKSKKAAAAAAEAKRRADVQAAQAAKAAKASTSGDTISASANEDVVVFLTPQELERVPLTTVLWAVCWRY